MHTCASKLSISILFAILFGSLLNPAHAELVPTEQLAADAKVRADRENIRAFLGRASAQQTLQAMGVAPEAAKQRVDALTDQEVQMVAGRIEALPAGGQLSASEMRLLVLVVAILAIVLII